MLCLGHVPSLHPFLTTLPLLSLCLPSSIKTASSREPVRPRDGPCILSYVYAPLSLTKIPRGKSSDQYNTWFPWFSSDQTVGFIFIYLFSFRGPLTNFVKREMRSFPRRRLIPPLFSWLFSLADTSEHFILTYYHGIWCEWTLRSAHMRRISHQRSDQTGGKKSFKFNFPFVRPAVVSSRLSTKTEKLFLTHPRSKPVHKQSQLPIITQCHCPPVQTVTRPDLITLSKLISDS